MKDIKTRLIEALLKTMTYDEMTEEQEKLVTEYETEKWKLEVDKLKGILSKEEIKKQIHDWWLDYQFTDGTEINLDNYVESTM